MSIAQTSAEAPWILLMFSLPTKKASQRVDIWRRLKRCGVVNLPGSGYLLPNTASNQEHFEWIGTSIRKFQGKATIVQVHAIDRLSHADLKQLFVDARSRDYELVLSELKKLNSAGKLRPPTLSRMRKRVHDIVVIDFFKSPLRRKIDDLLERAEQDTGSIEGNRKPVSAKDYRNRTWITRPRPGIDRVASAWLIRKFIDPKAKFVFHKDARHYPEAVPFDMFEADGFGHRGDDCTFETLVKEFAIEDPRTIAIGSIIHDADIEDEKFGRVEGVGLDRVLIGWAQQGLTDNELLRRGASLIEGLYGSVS